MKQFIFETNVPQRYNFFVLKQKIIKKSNFAVIMRNYMNY